MDPLLIGGLMLSGAFTIFLLVVFAMVKLGPDAGNTATNRIVVADRIDDETRRMRRALQKESARCKTN